MYIKKIENTTPLLGGNVINSLEIDSTKDSPSITAVNNKFKTYDNMVKQDLDLTELDSTKFYPVTWRSKDFVKLEVMSAEGSESAEYSQNRLRASISSFGYGDVKKLVDVQEFTRYADSDVTIYCIATGTTNGVNALYIRGGVQYRVRSNVILTLRTSEYTATEGGILSDNLEVFPLIDNGGTNITTSFNVDYMWFYTQGDSRNNWTLNKEFLIGTAPNGRNLYRKTFYISGITERVLTVYAHNITGITKVLDVQGVAYRGGLNVPVNFNNAEGYNECYVSGANIQCKFYWGTEAYISLIYMK